MPQPFVSTPPVARDVAVTAGVHSAPRGDIRSLIAGQLDPHDPEIDAQIVVNPRVFGITGWGDPNDQQFQSGHTNALPTNASAEQGWGVGPERRWAHMPSPDLPNPFRRSNVFMRDGGDAYSNRVYRPEVVAYWANALGYELAAVAVKQRASGYPTVNQPPSVPYVQIVPPVPPSPPVSPGGYY